jgi:hypothetical protein
MSWFNRSSRKRSQQIGSEKATQAAVLLTITTALEAQSAIRRSPGSSRVPILWSSEAIMLGDKQHGSTPMGVEPDREEHSVFLAMIMHSSSAGEKRSSV